MIVSSGQIASELAALGCQSIQPPRDSEVFCPTVEWLHQFGQWFLTEPTAKPIAGKRDCEDMTTKFIDRASDALVAADSIADGVGHSLGWGKVSIPAWLPDGEDNPGLNGITNDPRNWIHMTSIVRCSDNNWYFYEPQTARKTLARDAIDGGLVGGFYWAWV